MIPYLLNKFDVTPEGGDMFYIYTNLDEKTFLTVIATMLEKGLHIGPTSVVGVISIMRELWPERDVRVYTEEQWETFPKQAPFVNSRPDLN